MRGWYTNCPEKNLNLLIFWATANKIWIFKKLCLNSRACNENHSQSFQLPFGCLSHLYMMFIHSQKVAGTAHQAHKSIYTGHWTSKLFIPENGFTRLAAHIKKYLWIRPSSVWLLAVCYRKAHIKIKQYETWLFSDNKEHYHIGINWSIVGEMEKLRFTDLYRDEKK